MAVPPFFPVIAEHSLVGNFWKKDISNDLKEANVAAQHSGKCYKSTPSNLKSIILQ